MSAAILLDSAPLGLFTDPKQLPLPVRCRQWVTDLLAAGRRVIVPEIADYEVRRELLRANRRAELLLLDTLPQPIEYLPLTTNAMRKAAELWALTRQQGRPTAADAALDGDVILAAQALTLGGAVLIATSNPAHLTRYAPADDWRNVAP
jgi:predicted nucleic acid-binding protein